MNDATAPQQEKGKQQGLSWGLLAACLVVAITAIVLGVRAHHLTAQLSDSQAQLATAKAETSQALADLGNAKAVSADLQAKLDKAKAACGDLQSQLDTAKGACGDLQAQLDKAAAEKARQAADLKMQLGNTNAHSADLQVQLDQAAVKSSQLLAQLSQEKAQSMDLQARLQKAEGAIARLQPFAEKASRLPVTTYFNRSAWSGFGGQSSYTLSISILQPEPLKVDITITGGGKTVTKSGVIEYGATFRVEKLAAGDTVVITSTGYDPMNLTVK